MPERWTKKPVTVEVMRWDGTYEGAEAVQAWSGGKVKIAKPWKKPIIGSMDIETLEGDLLVRPGDWVICGVQGEFYPCRADIFAATYEPAAPSVPAVPVDEENDHGAV